MADVDGLIRFLFVPVGIAGAVHFLLMANAARNAPFFLKFIAYPLASACFVGMAYCAFLPGAAVEVGLRLGFCALSLMLVIWLAVHQAGMHVCDIMDHHAAVRAHKHVLAVVAKAKKEIEVATDRMTPSTIEAYWAMEEEANRKAGKS